MQNEQEIRKIMAFTGTTTNARGEGTSARSQNDATVSTSARELLPFCAFLGVVGGVPSGNG